MVEKDVIISNQKELEEKKKEILKKGKEKFHILADFDRTLTKAFVGGEKNPSIINELKRKHYVSEEYSRKATELANIYYPIEIDPNISEEEKTKEMDTWWKKHFELLIKSGLNKSHLKKIIDDGKIQFREGVTEFLDLLHEHKIPLIIISSSGLGEEIISMFLQKQERPSENIHIISNSYEWDENGNAIKINEPIIHVLNKDESAVRNHPIFSEIKNRKNVLLLGDSLGDVKMIHGFDYDNLIKIGFLNENIDENLIKYKENYDVIITDDGSMDYINKLLCEIVK